MSHPQWNRRGPESHHGLLLTQFHSTDRWGGSKYGEGLPAIVERGSLPSLCHGKVTLVLKAPLEYWIERHPPFGGKPQFLARCVIGDREIGEGRHDARATIGGAVARMRFHLTTSTWILEQHDMVAEEVVDGRLGREDVTRILTRAAYCLFLNYSKPWKVYTEFELPNWRRADVLGIDYGGEIRIMEVKSCRADFISDKKWEAYLKYSNRFSFITMPGVIGLDELPPDVGLYELNPKWPKKGSALVARRHPKRRKIGDLSRMLLAMVWRHPVSYYRANETLAIGIWDYNMRGCREK